MEINVSTYIVTKESYFYLNPYLVAMVGTHAVPTAKDLDALVLRLFALKAPKDWKVENGILYFKIRLQIKVLL